MIMKVFRMVLGIGLAIGLVHATLKYTGGDIWNEILHAQKPPLLLALFLQGLIISMAGFRWNLLLKVQGIDLRIWDLIRLTTTGVFFNLAIPGAVGGDLVKMGLLAQRARDKTAEAVLTVLLDRALGLTGLFIIASVAVLCSFPFLLSLEPKYRPIQIAAFTVGFGSIAGASGIVLMEFHERIMGYAPIARTVRYGAQRLPLSIVTTLKRLVAALELYRQKRSLILIALFLSVLIHSCLVCNLSLIGTSVGENVLTLRDYFLAVPVANAIAGIPVTPAGIGTRDAVIAMFLVSKNVPLEIVGVIPVLATFLILFWGLIGGLIFIFYKNTEILGTF